MKSNNQIKPILHHSVIIRHQEGFQTFSMRRPTTSQSFIIKTSSNYQKEVEHIMLKAVKKLKFLKNARFHNASECLGSYMKQASYLYLLKRMPQGRSISIVDGLFGPETFFSARKWLLWTKKLQTVFYLMNKRIPFPNIRSLFIIMYMLKIKKLIIVNFEGLKIDPNFFSHKLPRSLESLIVFGSDQDLSLYEQKPTLSHLTKLREIYIGPDMPNGVKLYLLNSISDFSNIKTLAFCHCDNIIGEEFTFLDEIQKSKKLETFMLDILSPKKFDVFFEALKDCPVTNLQISIIINQEIPSDFLDSFSMFLQNFKGLKSLELHKHYAFSSQAFCNSLFPALKKALIESTQLETFSLEIDQLETLEKFQEILDILRDRASTLKELKFMTAQIKPSKEQFAQLLDSLQYLKNLERLDMGTISIPDEELFERLILMACTWKNLQRLNLGRVLELRSESLFVRLNENILSKRGLEKFGCYLPTELAHRLSDSQKLTRISKRMVQRRNPYFESFPELPLIFTD